jgi:protoporphyrinogen oxidase
MSTCILAGGGIVSIFSALSLKKKYDKVFIIEKKDSVGGLLASLKINNKTYDYGTHIPALTGNPEIDETMYGNLSQIDDHWHKFKFLKSENYFNKKWYEESPLIDLQSFPTQTYEKAKGELLKLPAADSAERNLYQYLLKGFGETITESVYRPVLRKLLNTELEILDVDVLRMFGLQRVIGFSPEESRQLKLNPKYDSKIGFTSYQEGCPPHGYVYPKGRQGIGQWIDLLTKKLISSGVEIINSNSVDEIGHDGKKIINVKLTNSLILPCNHLLWSLPASLAFKALKEESPQLKPAFTTTTLFHFEFDMPLLKSRPYYLLCWEPGLLSYRITLYPNIESAREIHKGCHLTVEVLGNSHISSDMKEAQKIVCEELKMLKIVNGSANIVASSYEYLGNSFPVLTEEYLNLTRRDSTRLEQRFSNLHLIGRSSGKSFFINDLLAHANDLINEKLF